MALGPSKPSVEWVVGTVSPGVKHRGVKVTTHLHVVLKLRMRGAIPLLHCLSLRAQERVHCHLTYEARVCSESILFAGLVSDYLPCQNVTQ